MTWHCENCRFFDDSGGHTGTCKRFPPQRDNQESRYPSVSRFDQCGEFRQKYKIISADELRAVWAAQQKPRRRSLGEWLWDLI